MQKGSHAKTQEGPHAKTQRRKGKSFLVPKEVCVTCLSGMWMAQCGHFGVWPPYRASDCIDPPFLRPKILTFASWREVPLCVLA
jgi:hypothetical protein